VSTATQNGTKCNGEPLTANQTSIIQTLNNCSTAILESCNDTINATAQSKLNACGPKAHNYSKLFKDCLFSNGSTPTSVCGCGTKPSCVEKKDSDFVPFRDLANARREVCKKAFRNCREAEFKAISQILEPCSPSSMVTTVSSYRSRDNWLRYKMALLQRNN